MSKPVLCRLEQIVIEEGDLDLFPDSVVQAFKSGVRGPIIAHEKLLEANDVEIVPARRRRQQYWLSRDDLWAVEHLGPMEPPTTQRRRPRVKAENSLLADVLFLGRFRGAFLTGLLVALSAFVRLGHEVGAALGTPDFGALIAFWLGIAGVATVLARQKSTPTGLHQQTIVGVAVIASIGAAMLATARTIRGTDVAQWLGPLGFALFVLPLGWAFFQLLLGERSD